MRTGRALAILVVVGGLAGLAFLAYFAPALSFALALAVPRSEPWVAAFTAEPAHQEVVVEAPGRLLPADLYRPPHPRGGILLVHGLSRAGRRHQDLVRLARLLARFGQVVLVPEFPGLVAFQLSGREIDEVDAAIGHLRRHASVVGVAGFSFGAGPALLAAARHPDLALTASFGGYADLHHVVTYVTTGVHRFQGRRYTQPQETYNRWKLLALLAGFVEDSTDRRLLQTVAARKLVDPANDTGVLEADAGRAARAVLGLVRNDREEAVPALFAALPAPAREAIDRLSPIRVADRLPGRVLLAHGTGDPSIPYTESLLLAAAAGPRARMVILGSFHHTGPGLSWQSAARVVDAGKLVLLAHAVLRPW